MRKKLHMVTARDEKILRAIYEHRYMTILDVAWLLFTRSSKTHVGEILAKLSDGQDLQPHAYLCRFGLPAVGRPQLVYTLGAKGRRYLSARGLPVSWYFRPSKLAHFSALHVQHQLLLTRVVVAARVWSRTHAEFNLVNVRFGRPATVTREATANTITVPVIPDAWLLFERVRNGNLIPIFLEIDRGTEYRERFKQHIRARIQFIEEGGYAKTFGTKSVTIAYATTATTGHLLVSSDTRRKTMAGWTMDVLAELGLEHWARNFRFVSVDYTGLFDLALFEKPVWYPPDSPTPRTLLTP
jgi:Replication-relaxation